MSLGHQLWLFVFVLFCFVPCSTLCGAYAYIHTYRNTVCKCACLFCCCLCHSTWSMSSLFLLWLLWRLPADLSHDLRVSLQVRVCVREGKPSADSPAVGFTDSCKISAAKTPPSNYGHNNKAKAFAVVFVVAAITGFLFRYEHCDNFCSCKTKRCVKWV